MKNATYNDISTALDNMNERMLQLANVYYKMAADLGDKNELQEQANEIISAYHESALKVRLAFIEVEYR